MTLLSTMFAYSQATLMFEGNIALVICCAFYLLWWIIAFHPHHPIKGFKSGWLLIFALVFGVIAIVQIIRGGCDEAVSMPYPRWAILVGGIAIYIILLAGTYLLLKRQVTTELLLIVGWAALMFLELGALQGLGQFSTEMLIVLLVVVVAVAVASLVCYLLYYNLDNGYIDGMIPLILIAATVIAVMVVMELSNT